MAYLLGFLDKLRIQDEAKCGIICKTFVLYLQKKDNILTKFAQYLNTICTIFAEYLYEICTV